MEIYTCTHTFASTHYGCIHVHTRALYTHLNICYIYIHTPVCLALSFFLSQCFTKQRHSLSNQKGRLRGARNHKSGPFLVPMGPPLPRPVGTPLTCRPRGAPETTNQTFFYYLGGRGRGAPLPKSGSFLNKKRPFVGIKKWSFVGCQHAKQHPTQPPPLAHLYVLFEDAPRSPR